MHDTALFSRAVCRSSLRPCNTPTKRHLRESPRWVTLGFLLRCTAAARTIINTNNKPTLHSHERGTSTATASFQAAPATETKLLAHHACLCLPGHSRIALQPTAQKQTNTHGVPNTSAASNYRSTPQSTPQSTRSTRIWHPLLAGNRLATEDQAMPS